mgnify:CR=1 FL=1
MRVATWNLLHATPILGAESGATLREQAKLIHADIIGLQEVDRNQPRSGHAHQLQEVAQALELPYWVYAPTVVGTPGEQWEDAHDHHVHTHEQDTEHHQTPHYGNALASRYPLTDIEILRFPAAPLSLPLLVPGDKKMQVLKVADEPRIAIICTAHTPIGPITVATTHLSFVPGFNIKQLRKLTKELTKRNHPALVLGDFNLIGSIPRLISKWDMLARIATYPVFKPRIQFDHILAKGFSDVAVKRAQQSAQRLALDVSDHCALVVTING